MEEHVGEPRVHHEESDVNIRAIFQFGTGLAVVAVVIHVLIWGLFVLFDRREAQVKAQYPLAAGQDALPPEPRLQVVPRQDLRDLRAQQDATLNGYRWVDREAGTVRIPIAEAMRLTVERGLPSRADPGQTPGPDPAQTTKPDTGRTK
jgi:hypothetical protein